MSYNFPDGDRLSGTLTTGLEVDTGGPVQSVTLACWVKKTAAQWNNGSNDTFFALGASTTVQDGQIFLRAPSTADTVEARQGQTSPTAASSASESFADTTYDDKWILVVGVFTNDSLRDVYINGSTLTGQNTTARAITTTMTNVAIGSNTHSRFVTAESLVAECCIWNKALDPTDIDALWTSDQTGPAPNTIQPNNVVGYWPLNTDRTTEGTILNEATGTSADATGTLTIESDAAWNESHPIITSGSTNETVYPFTGPWR